MEIKKCLYFRFRAACIFETFQCIVPTKASECCLSLCIYISILAWVRRPQKVPISPEYQSLIQPTSDHTAPLFSFLSNSFLKLINYFVFLAALGLHCCERALSSCCEQRLPFIAGHGLLVVVTSLAGEHRLQGRRLSICSTRAQQLWRADLVAPRHVKSFQTRDQPVSCALARGSLSSREV